MGLEGIVSKRRGQLQQEREKPQLAEDQEPGFRQDVIVVGRLA
jgi:hypothetical protein